MSEEKFFYKVESFCPPVDRLELGRYGFSVRLQGDFARRAFEKELQQQGHDNLQKYGKGIIKNVGSTKGDYIRDPYDFARNENGNLTCLVKCVNVPGDACYIFAEKAREDNLARTDWKYPISYDPHNVDTMKQAFALLSIWLSWANLIEAHLD